MKKIITVLLCLSLFLLVACAKQQPTQPGDLKYIGGTEGVTVNFEPIGVEEEGVQNIYDDEVISLEVVVKNRGERDISPKDIKLELLGPAQELFTDISKWEESNTEAIDSISEFNPEGGEEVISFATEGKYTAPVTGFTDLEWFVNYEYNYATEAIISNVCFKEDPTDKRVCTVEESKSISVSGAPIQVTAVEEDTAGRGVMVLRIDIENVAGGDVTLLGEEFDTRFGKIAYVIDEPDRWECKSGGRVDEARLIDGKAIIRCKLKEALPEGELSVKEVKFTLNYAYQDIVQETLRIKESAR